VALEAAKGKYTLDDLAKSHIGQCVCDFVSIFESNNVMLAHGGAPSLVVLMSANIRST